MLRATDVPEVKSFSKDSKEQEGQTSAHAAWSAALHQSEVRKAGTPYTISSTCFVPTAYVPIL
jgi:hypothetical protein